MKNKTKKTTKTAKAEKDSKLKEYEFGKMEVVSLDKLLGIERGSVLQVFGQVCNCGMYNSDPYNCTSGLSDNRC